VLGLLLAGLCVLRLTSAQPLRPTHPEDADPEPGGASDDGGVTVVALAAPDASVAAGRGVQVTAAELLERVRDAPLALQRGYAADAGALRALTDRLVADRLLVAEARRRGLESDPVVRAALERALLSRLRATVLNPAAGDASGIRAEDIQRFYNAHPERFRVLERRRVRIIFVRTRAEANSVLRLLRMRRRGRPVHEFRALAERYNATPALRARGGELREVTRESPLDPALRAELFRLPTEGTPPPPRVVAGRWEGVQGFFLARFVSRRAGIDRSLAESSDWIRQRLLLERRVAVEAAEAARLEREANVVRAPLERILRVEVTSGADGGR
jgi:hypothetical protein